MLPLCPPSRRCFGEAAPPRLREAGALTRAAPSAGARHNEYIQKLDMLCDVWHTSIWSYTLALVGLVVVCVLSRMTMSESILGAYGQSQMLRTVLRLTADAETQMEMSHQDTDPFVGLLHNLEASAYFRAAKRLAEESRIVSRTKKDFVSTLAELSQEQDSLLHRLMDQHPL